MKTNPDSSVMNEVEKIKENAKIGQEILEQLNKMSDKEIIEKMISILPNVSMLSNNPACERVIRNEHIFTITLSVWDTIEINALGVNFKPEHGYWTKLVEFNKHFKL